MYYIYFKTLNETVFNLDLLLHRYTAMAITEAHTKIAVVIITARIVMSILCFNEKI